LQKPVSWACLLRIRLVNCMVLRTLRLFKKFFQVESDPKMRFGCIAHNVTYYAG